MKRAIVTGLLIAIVSTGALAQSRPPASAPAAPASGPIAEPQQTTAVFGDWTLRCVRAGEGVQSKRTCEITQMLQAQVQGQNQPFAQLAAGRIEAGQPLRFVGLMPVNIAFPSSVKVSLDETDTQPLELIWRRCMPGACVADVELAQPMIARLRSKGEGGRMSFKDGTGRDVTVNISLRGFGPALDALLKETP